METPRSGTPGTGTAYAQQTAPPNPPTQPAQAAGAVADQAKDAAQDVAGQVQDAGKQVVGQVQEQAVNTVQEQIGRVTETLGSFVDATRSVSGQLRQSDQAMVAEYVEQAASQVERLAAYLENKEPAELVGDVERFARRQPAMFMGGAFVLGLMAARFLKSSRQAAYDAGYQAGSYGEPGYHNPYASGYATGGYEYAAGAVPQPPPYYGRATPAPVRGGQPTTRREPEAPPFEPTV